MRAETILQVKSLAKNFDGLQAVRGVSFEVEKGTILGIIGPNGSGKSTLFNMIAGAFPPSAGKIIYSGEDITGFKPYQLYARGLVRTFQLSQEYPRLTSLENLMVAGMDQPGENIFMNWIAVQQVMQREKEVLDRAEETLEFLGLTNLRDELAGKLSGGQKKLLELGRTMMTDTRLVLMDEPGAGINPTLMLKVIEMIMRLNQERGYTFCIIEHDMDLIASLCKRTLVLVEGQILTEGAMEDLRKDERVIDAYFGGGGD